MKHSCHMPLQFAGLKVLQHSQPVDCRHLSQQGVYITKMEKLLLQENGSWPDKVIIYSIPHATCKCQADDFHACRRKMVLWFKPWERLWQPALRDSEWGTTVPFCLSSSSKENHATPPPLFIGSTMPHWLECFSPSSFLGPWYWGALTSATTVTAALLCGAFHARGACSAALSSQSFCFINGESLWYYELGSRPSQLTWDELKISH